MDRKILNMTPSEFREQWTLEAENYRTHSILHRCFPPRPKVCMVCGANGHALYDKPCAGLLDLPL